jgi:hypothetical protein
MGIASTCKVLLYGYREDVKFVDVIGASEQEARPVATTTAVRMR